MMCARLAAAISISVLAVLAVAPAQADALGEFYSDHPINFIVGSGPGGSHDIYARLLARHLGVFLPGNPRVTVQNMPGADSLRAASYLYNFAPRDGTAIGMFSRNMPLIGLLGGSNVQYDPRKFTWLGSPASFHNDANILVVRKDAPVKSIEEACRRDLPPLVLGGSADGGAANDVPIILRDTIGLHVKQVVGYPDSPSIFAAIERGEVHGRTVDLSTLKSVRPQWLKPDSPFRVLVQFARATRQERSGARADRGCRAGLCHLAADRRAAGPASRACGCAGAGFFRRPARPAIPRGRCRPAAGREPDGRRGVVARD